MARQILPHLTPLVRRKGKTIDTQRGTAMRIWIKVALNDRWGCVFGRNGPRFLAQWPHHHGRTPTRLCLLQSTGMPGQTQPCLLCGPNPRHIFIPVGPASDQKGWSGPSPVLRSWRDGGIFLRHVELGLPPPGAFGGIKRLVGIVLHPGNFRHPVRL